MLSTEGARRTAATVGFPRRGGVERHKRTLLCWIERHLKTVTKPTSFQLPSLISYSPGQHCLSSVSNLPPWFDVGCPPERMCGRQRSGVDFWEVTEREGSTLSVV